MMVYVAARGRDLLCEIRRLNLLQFVMKLVLLPKINYHILNVIIVGIILLKVAFSVLSPSSHISIIQFSGSAQAQEEGYSTNSKPF
jgi:hypothetical protein